MNRRQLLATGIAATVAGATGLPALASDDGALIKRISISPERRVFCMDVQNLTLEDAHALVARAFRNHPLARVIPDLVVSPDFPAPQAV